MQEKQTGASLYSGRRNKIVVHLQRRQRNKRKMRRTTNPCESKRLWGLYLAAPCGNDNGHLGTKRTTIHLNPGLHGKTHNPPNTHDPPRVRRQEKLALWSHGIRQNNTHFSPSLKTQHDYLTFPGIHSICQPALIPSLTKSSPLHLWDYPSLLLVLQSD